MKKLILVSALSVAMGVVVITQSSCSSCPPGDARCNSGVGGGGNGGTGGGGGGGAVDLYTRFVLDPKPSDRFFLDIAVDTTASSQRVGVAYIAGQGEYALIYAGDAGITSDGGIGVDYDVRYVEWKDGVVGTPEVVDVVQRMMGISIDFHPTNGQPAVAYLGGGSDGSLFWFNSDAELSVRSSTGTWASERAATNGAQVTCGNPVSDVAAGLIVGVWPAIKYTSTGTLWYCYRDVHTGQYPQGDWAGSDVECLHAAPSPPSSPWMRDCTRPGGNFKDAPGGRIRMTMINDEPTIIWDQVFGGADTSGQNVWMQSHNTNAWTVAQPVVSIAATQTGATVAYDATEGLGVAVLDATQNILYYSRKQPGHTMWDIADQVFGDGSGGWYSSLAMDPVFHEPAIAFYVCSTRSGANQGGCQPEYDEVRVAQRVAGNWQNHMETVDPEGGYNIRLGFLPDGRKVVAYRDLKTGALKLAVRKVP